MMKSKSTHERTMHHSLFCSSHKNYLLPELPEERFEVRLCLRVCRTGQLALNAALHVVLSAVQIFGPNAKKKLESNNRKTFPRNAVVTNTRQMSII